MEQMLIYLLLIINSVALGYYNAYRGSGSYKATDTTPATWFAPYVKGFTFFLFGMSAYLWSGSYLASILFVIPVAVNFALGTGEQMQAFTKGIKNISKKTFISYLVNKVVGVREFPTLAFCRKWGVWYGSFMGVLYSLPIVVMSCIHGFTLVSYVAILMSSLMGLLCGALRYRNGLGAKSYGWRYYFEFGYYAVFYSAPFLYYLSQL
jgi:hypothetical protein